MRYKSKKLKGYTVYAVAGMDVVSFAIDFSGAGTKGLLGFAVERHDMTEDEKYFMKGFKVFQEVFPDPAENVLVSTNEHPVQSFVWDDFTAKPDHQYEYFFYPVKGKPKFLKREAPIPIRVDTEKVFTDLPEEHDVFFNRGVASSQEYARKFFNQPPDKIQDPTLRKQAEEWLTRKLKPAFYKFIDQAKKGDSLFGCFYEFHYEEAVQKFKDAIDRGVKVTLIIDCKDNGTTKVDKKGKTTTTKSFPKETNLETLRTCGIDPNGANIIQRTARPNNIAHNKFLLLQPKGSATPTQVWTGSTNISEGGIYGQTNVGHWIKNAGIAQEYKVYWDLLATNPGAKEGSDTVRDDNKNFKVAVEAISADLTAEAVLKSPENLIPIFSPRPDVDMLDTYFELVDSSKESACITLAFGVSQALKDKLLDNTYKNSIVFMMLEKKDEPRGKDDTKREASVVLNTRNNVYAAYGSYIDDPLNKWVKETNTQQLNLNTHVMYIHTKFLLRDPLSAQPVIVTGSANFSDASTKENDENMVIIKNNLRAADIYFTEFNRLFNHYYFRSVLLDLKAQGKTPDESQLFLSPDDSWLEKYTPGKLRLKRVQMFANMKGTKTLPSGKIS